MNNKLSLAYADIALNPINLSEISSRNNIDTSCSFLGFDLKLPVLSAPMRTVTGAKMAQAMRKGGGLGILYRIEIATEDQDWDELSQGWETGLVPSVAATGALIERVKYLYSEYKVRAICIDTANGYHKIVGDAICMLKKEFKDLKIIAGNAGSLEGYIYLFYSGVDAVRVGIGSGACCSTSLATGVGVGQVSLIREISKWRVGKEAHTPLVIADGGIKEVGDICKAISLGANVVMLGSMLAGTAEAPGEVIDGKKRFFGEASRGAKGAEGRYIEGVTTLIPYKGPVNKILEEISDGLRSSMAYMNCKNLEEFRCLPDECFVQLSLNARIERLPYLSTR